MKLTNSNDSTKIPNKQKQNNAKNHLIKNTVIINSFDQAKGRRNDDNWYWINTLRVS